MTPLPNHDKVLAQIRGQAVVLPDFSSITAQWPRLVNSNYSMLREEADKRLNRLLSDGKKSSTLKAADIELLISFAFPRAEVAELRVMTLYTLWLHAWDDEMDDTDGLYTNDLVAAQEYFDSTLHYVKISLGLEEGSKQAGASNKIVECFSDVGSHLQQSYTKEQCEMVFNETQYFVDMVREEQRAHLSDTFPTKKEYKSIRMGSGAVGLFLSAVEYMYQIRAPRDIRTDEIVKQMWDGVNNVVCTTNDILSMKKEIKADRVLNLVTLDFAEHGNLQNAIDKAHVILLEEIVRFEEDAAKFLLQPMHKAFHSEAQILVQGFRDIMAGCFHWHFESGRFGLLKEESKDGRISITF